MSAKPQTKSRSFSTSASVSRQSAPRISRHRTTVSILLPANQRSTSVDFSQHLGASETRTKGLDCHLFTMSTIVDSGEGTRQAALDHGLRGNAERLRSGGTLSNGACRSRSMPASTGRVRRPCYHLRTTNERARRGAVRASISSSRHLSRRSTGPLAQAPSGFGEAIACFS